MTARFIGAACMLIAVVLIVLALVDFFTAINGHGLDGGPTKFWMFFAALPFFVIGAIGLNAGFLGAGARYVAGELAPTARDTLEYVGVGSDAASPCPRCGTANDAQASYCQHCGSAMRRTCPSCKQPNAADAHFCAACGTELAN
jgi:hypothetical protein